MAHAHTIPPLSQAEEALTALFCLADDAYRLLNPRWQGYQALEKLSDSEVLALFQQLTAVFIKVDSGPAIVKASSQAAATCSGEYAYCCNITVSCGEPCGRRLGWLFEVYLLGGVHAKSVG